MICEACRDAGYFNAMANAASDRVAELMRMEVPRFHAECPGGTACDCQHMTGMLLRSQP